MRKLAIFGVAFSAGIALAQYLLPTEWVLPAALACFLFGLGALCLPDGVSKRGILIGVGLSLALSYHWLYVRQVQAPMEANAGTEGAAVMTLQEYAVATDYGAKVTVKAEGLPGKVVYYGSELLLELEPGQTVAADVRYQSASRIRDDQVTTFTSKGVFLLAYQKGEEVIGSGSADSIRWWPVRAGRCLQTRIGELFSDDAAGFMTAVLTGDKSSLSEDAGTALSESGLYHILAVSGMHCGFLLALVVFITGRQRRRLTAVTAISVLVFYALLTGCSPSVVRACVMLSLLVAAPIFQRESDPPTSLMTALLLILLRNPFAVASVSLQLSFAAVAGLLWLTPKLYALLAGDKKRSKPFIYIAGGFSATMGALVFSTPISAWYFGALPLVSPISNLLCLWAAGVVFVLGLIAVLLSFLWLPLGTLLASVASVVVEYILLCTRLLTKLPWHSVYFTNPYLKYWLAGTYLVLAATYLLKSKGKGKYALCTVLAALTLVLTVHLGQKPYQNDLDIVMLDVGQGQSVVLSSGDAWLLTDCGSANSWYDAGEIAAHQLATMGCRRLDGVLLTHYDRDHVSGIAGLLARMDVETLLVPAGQEDNKMCNAVLALAESHDVDVCVIVEETRISLGKTEVRVLPVGGSSPDSEQELALLASLDGQDFLLTGDMDAAKERRLLKHYDLPDIEILVAGHHGSKYSTTKDLLEQLTPEFACISVGSNSYGHPTEETLQRLAEYGCTVYRTDLHGEIHLPINEGEEYGTGDEKTQQHQSKQRGPSEAEGGSCQ